MRPIKNRFFCLACGKPKMLFSTQKKADNFIKFNADDIMEETGIKPARSYYCQLCFGYHVTSLRSEKVGKRFDQNVQNVIDAYNANQARRKRA